MTREELYQRFGPKLIDAKTRAEIKLFNQILDKIGLPQITGQQIIDSIANELEQIPDYDWMNEGM